MTINTQTGKRSFGRRVLWILKTVFVSLLLIAIIGGIAYGVFLGVEELNRSMDSLVVRIEANSERITLMDERIDAVRADDPSEHLRQLEAGLDDVNGRFADFQTQLTAQSDLLAAMQEEVALAADTSAASVADTATLGDAFLALQNDINESNGRIDALGGEIDGLNGKFDDLQTEAGQLETTLGQFAGTAVTDADIDSLQQTLALFHIWEQIARARLHLAENNAGLATDEVEQALRLTDFLVANAAEENAQSLALVQTRLGLAFNSLPDDAETAVLDLENAWSQLDAILTARLFPEAAVTQIQTETETEEATPEPTATPTG